MKILVTGGAGFIGSHLSERLLATGHRVVVLDNFNAFYDPAVKRRNIEKALQSPEYRLLEGDILDVDMLHREVDDSFDMVIHLAAYAGVRPSIEDPSLYQRVNIEGTLNLLECCRRAEIDKFIFASSSSVYGGRTETPFREPDNIMNPISPYAASKVAGEALCYCYHHLWGMKVHMHRFFTVYGPRQRPEMAIHLFARKMREGRAIDVFGDGKTSRDYTYIDDIVDGVMGSVERVDGCDVFNLGGSKTITLSRLIEVIGRSLGVTPVIQTHPDQPGDVPITCADVSKAARMLNYHPRVDIEQGIGRFCRWLTSIEAVAHGAGAE